MPKNLPSGASEPEREGGREAAGSKSQGRAGRRMRRALGVTGWAGTHPGCCCCQSTCMYNSQTSKHFAWIGIGAAEKQAAAAGLPLGHLARPTGGSLLLGCTPAAGGSALKTLSSSHFFCASAWIFSSRSRRAKLCSFVCSKQHPNSNDRAGRLAGTPHWVL